MEHSTAASVADRESTSAAPSPRRARAEAPRAPRHDIYVHIHKAVRACMTETLVAAGRLDPDDAADVAAVAAQVRALLALCRAHLDKEEAYIHPAMEARRPGSTADIAADHVHHLEAFGRLAARLDAVERASGAARGDAAAALYRDLCLFVADNFVHMHAEEVDHNAVLQAAYDDDELRALEAALVASIPPAEKLAVLRWMVPAMAPADRAAMLTGLRAAVPAPAFAAIMAAVEPHLGETDRRKLAAALAR